MLWIDTFFEHGEICWARGEANQHASLSSYALGTARNVIFFERDYFAAHWGANAGFSFEGSNYPVSVEAVSWSGNVINLHFAGFRFGYFVEKQHTSISLVVPCWLILLTMVPLMTKWRRRRQLREMPGFEL